MWPARNVCHDLQRRQEPPQNCLVLGVLGDESLDITLARLQPVDQLFDHLGRCRIQTVLQIDHARQIISLV